jgi:addiction module HigA family antidote
MITSFANKETEKIFTTGKSKKLPTEIHNSLDHAIKERNCMSIENGLPPIHPGVFLKEILDELGMSQNTFAQAIGVSPMRISHVVKGFRPVTAELAVLFGKVFGQTPTYWMNLQTSYDLKTAEKNLVQRLRHVQPFSLAA